MASEQNSKNAVEIARIGEKIDLFTQVMQSFTEEQRTFNRSIARRIDVLEKTTERWKGIWVGGIAIVTAIFSLISLYLRFR